MCALCSTLRSCLFFFLFTVFVPHGVSADGSPPAEGIYWGNFDPPTLAHKEIILQVIDKLKLDKIFIAVNDFEGKLYYAPIEDRMAMVKLMLYGLEGKIQVISQNERVKADYEAIKRTAPGKLYAIAGQDSYEKWQSKPIGNLMPYDAIVIVPRGRKSEIDIRPEFKSKVVVLDLASRYRHFSSTKIREKLMHNHCIGLDPSVCGYIQQHHLYHF